MTREEFVTTLATSGRIAFPPGSPDAVRTIDASWINYALQNVPQVVISNALVSGPLRLDSTVIESILHFESCTFSEITCRYARFRHWFKLENSIVTDRASFRGANFDAGVWFRGSKFNEKLDLSYVRMSAELDCTRIFCAEFLASGLRVTNNVMSTNCEILRSYNVSHSHVGGQFDVSSSKFVGAVDIFDTYVGEFECVRATFCGDARIQRLHSSSLTNFSETVFFGATTFMGSDLSGQLNCIRTSFRGSVHFECRVGSDFIAWGATFGALASFNGSDFYAADFSNSEFVGPTSYLDVSVRHGLAFNGCRFASDLHLDRISVEGTLSIERTTLRSAYFGGVLSFAGASIVGQMNAGYGTVIGTLSLEGAKILADLHFQQTACSSECKLSGLSVGGDCDWQGSRFREACVLSGSTIRGNTVFNSCQLPAGLTITQSDLGQDLDLQGASAVGVTLDGSRVKGRLLMTNTKIDGTLSCRGAIVTRVVMDQSNVDSRTSSLDLAHAELDFRDFRYESLDMPWRPLVNALGTTSHFSRQPVLKLEDYFRSIGRNDIGDEIYIEGRKAAARREPRKSFRGLIDILEQILTGYGARPLWSLGWAALLVALAFIVYSIPGSVQPSTSYVVTQTARAAQVSAGTPTCEYAPDFQDKLALSIVTYVPGEHEVDGWTASSCPWGAIHLKPYVVVGVLQVIGAIIFPLLIATITGLLQYVSERSTRAQTNA